MAARRTAVPQLDALFRPGRIGPLELPNRIIVPAMDMGYDEGGYVSDRHVAFCEARAKGGVAMQIVGGCAVSPEGIFGDHFLRIDDDRFLPGLRRLTEAVHRHGSLVAAQLFHAGRDAFGAGSEAIAPSPVPSRLTKRTPRAMTEEDIHRVVADFAAAARRAREAGFDAVEILGSSGFLIAQFLSPLTNRRTDAYGGSAENRLRFALEVVRAVRAAVGSDYPVLFRHTVDDLMPGGNDLEANLAFAPAIEAAGVDAFTVQVGWEESSVPTVWMTVPRGAWVWMAEALKGVVGK
ncbi:MAG: NADH:flavin oxidoreductase, partial [Clostridia bacterium]|nr:NADH:flavin oxidoreductase [Clostridia bacterium]